MLEPMYVRCYQCGYDNSPEYRFCGMCGGALPHPAKETLQPERDVVLPPTPDQPPLPRSASVAPIPVSAAALGGAERVHGPSFLGLSDDQPERLDHTYEYEDEPQGSRAGLIAVLLLLVAAAGFLGWQWRHDGFPFNHITAGNPPAPAAVPDASPAPQTPASDKPADKTGDKTTTANGDVPAATPDSVTPTDSSAKAASGPAPEAESTSSSADQPAPPDKTAEASPRTNRPEKSPPKSPDLLKTRAKTSSPEPAALAASPDADLELAGERYLYGTGLPQNCARAESSLRTAATHGNSKAETVLGTMYATGHCVGRDLPTAYRWFARGLHKDPQNSRISADLQVLWRQMTPEEKQLATTSGH